MTDHEREAIVDLLCAYEEELLEEWHGCRGFARMAAADPVRLLLGLPVFVPCPGVGAGGELSDCACHERYGARAVRARLASLSDRPAPR